MARADVLRLDDGGRAVALARWAGAGAVALAAHALVAVLLRDAAPPPGSVTPPAIEMDLTPPPAGPAQTSEVGAESAAAVDAEATPETAPDEAEPVETEAEALPEMSADEATPPEPDEALAERPPEALSPDDAPTDEAAALDAPAEAVEAEPEIAEVPLDVAPAAPLPPEQTVVAEEPRPAPTRQAVRRPEPRREAPRPAVRRPADARERPQPRREASSAARTGGATGTASNPGAARAAAADYARRLNALLASQQRYPTAARADRLTGRAVISFVVNRSGRVVSQSIASSSGHAILDAELQAMLRRAAGSFPPMPPEIQGATKSFTLPMTFRFRGG